MTIFGGFLSYSGGVYLWSRMVWGHTPVPTIERFSIYFVTSPTIDTPYHSQRTLLSNHISFPSMASTPDGRNLGYDESNVVTLLGSYVYYS